MKHLLLACLLLTASEVIFAQGKANSLEGVPAKERIVMGGGFGLGFGSDQDFFSISPTIGYQITRKFMAGTGVSYQYAKYKFVQPAISLNHYGLNPFARYTVFKNVFAQAEYEYLNFEFPTTITETTRKNFNSFFAGGGIIQPLGGKLSLYFMALYNFSYTTPKPNQYTPYDSPLVIRAGVTIGNFGF